MRPDQEQTSAIARVASILQSEIRESYTSVDQVRAEVEDESYFVTVAYYDEDGNAGITELTSPSQSVPGDIVGVGRSRRQTLDGYDEGREFDALSVIRESDKISESDFPLLEYRTGAVDEAYHGEGMGTRISWDAVKRAERAALLPVLSTLWKKANGKNGHIRKVLQFAEKVATVDEGYRTESYCKICDAYECDCKGVVILYT